MSTNESLKEVTHTTAELGTIWEVPDALWDKIIKPVLEEFDPPKKMGRPRADQRRCLDGIIHRARTGCQWNQLPAKFGDDATVHRTLQRWESLSIFDRVWALLIYHCENLGGVHWDWQAADGCLNKARFIGKRGKSMPPHKNQEAARQKNERAVQKPPKKQPTLKKEPTQRQMRGKTRAKASAPIRPTVEKWASKTACLSRETAVRLLS